MDEKENLESIEFEQDEDGSNVELLKFKKVDHNFRPESLPELKIKNVQEELQGMDGKKKEIG